MKSLYLIIVIYGEEQWLDIAQAMHTIEMIPKSMILIQNIILAFIYIDLFGKLKSKLLNIKFIYLNKN
jgi:hypothetical protein